MPIHGNAIANLYLQIEELRLNSPIFSHVKSLLQPHMRFEVFNYDHSPIPHRDLRAFTSACRSPTICF